MTEPLVIVDMVGALVQKVEAAVLPALQAYDPLIEGVFYEYGHGVEILRTLKQKDESQSFRNKKYPLIALLQDFPERRGQQAGIYAETDLTLVICHHTQPEWVSKERYTTVFKPVLYPIYAELIHQLETAAISLVGPGGLVHEKIDHPYYGREGKNVGYDFLDAIEISGLTLNLYESNC
jgi:hypothetical protein